jgi:hypothetical protein
MVRGEIIQQRSLRMQIKFKVQNPHMTPSSTRAVVNGKEMTVSVEAFEVDLVSEDPINGGLKLRFIGDQVDAAKGLFNNDAMVTATFA